MQKRIVTAILIAGLLIGCSKPAEDPTAVNFNLPDVNNMEVKLSDFRGKWVIVNFWATWCGPCLQELPELIRFHQEYSHSNAMVVGINFEEIDKDSLAEFIEDKGINYPIVRAGAEPILPFEPLKGLPTTFLIDPEGHLIKRHIGPVTKSLLSNMISNNAKSAP